MAMLHQSNCSEGRILGCDRHHRSQSFERLFQHRDTTLAIVILLPMAILNRRSKSAGVISKACARTAVPISDDRRDYQIDQA